MKLVLINQSKVRMPRGYLESWVKLVVRKLKSLKAISVDAAKKELVVVFMDTSSARKLNQQYRSKNYATDVLSFSSDDPESLGELVLCPQVLLRQAKEHGLNFRQETAYMVLHGMLHLLGYEHEAGGRAAKKMYALQDRVFQSIDKL